MSIPLRWRLFDMETGTALTDCTDIDGLFVDRVFPAEPLYERYTLLSCAPSAALLAAIDGSGTAWLGNVVVEGAHLADRPAEEQCEDQCWRCYQIAEELLDVRVVAPEWSPAPTGKAATPDGTSPGPLFGRLLELHRLL